MRPLFIALDFDGTCVTHAYPYVGKDVGAVPVLKKMVAAHHKIILYTMRDSDNAKDLGIDVLKDALNWFKQNDIPLYAVNCNPSQRAWTSSPKIYAHVYIDDAALGIPLKLDENLSPRPFVDWTALEVMLKDRGIINDESDISI